MSPCDKPCKACGHYAQCSLPPAKLGNGSSLVVSGASGARLRLPYGCSSMSSVVPAFRGYRGDSPIPLVSNLAHCVSVRTSYWTDYSWEPHHLYEASRHLGAATGSVAADVGSAVGGVLKVSISSNFWWERLKRGVARVDWELSCLTGLAESWSLNLASTSRRRRFSSFSFSWASCEGRKMATDAWTWSLQFWTGILF